VDVIARGAFAPEQGGDHGRLRLQLAAETTVLVVAHAPLQRLSALPLQLFANAGLALDEG